MFFITYILQTSSLKQELELELENSLLDKYQYTTYMAKNTWLEKLYKYSRETKANVQEYGYH